MIDELRQLVFDTLRAMNYDTDDGAIDDGTTLGPAGLDLESLSIVELGLRVEEAHGVPFDEEIAERMPAMTLGEFLADTADRIAAARSEVPAR